MDRNRNTFTAGSALMAQKGLQVNTLFDGRFKKDHRAVEVLIKGKELKKYHLNLFRSLTVTNAPAVFREMETLVCQDAKKCRGQGK